MVVPYSDKYYVVKHYVDGRADSTGYFRNCQEKVFQSFSSEL